MYVQLSPHSPVVSIGDENAGCAPASLEYWSSAMPRRRFKQTSPLDQRLTEQAQRLRKEAQGTPPGIERERLIRRARQAETASHMQEWLTSPGLKPPG
ncbi:hypothetical protein SAMN05444158_3437 [Bradyrhizobium canariense]|uniref:Uncharacterized protein n=1 Tax=Bradyrhizobium canariense TaxID=255045 RepID=A0A1H1VIY7_9BRAD|nr:hypothetical protein SAMN05444158_3437 [Bradyrhizobium canariense]